MRSPAGFTLLELLVVVGIVGVLVGAGAVALRPPSAYLFARDLTVMLQQARFEAIKRNAPVAVVWSGADQAFVTRWHPSNPSVSQACSGPTVLNVKRLSEYRNVSVRRAFNQNGVVWLPSGLGAQCGGGLMMNSTQLTDGRATYNVVISSAGRVRVTRP